MNNQKRTETSFIALVGPSASGKTSLSNALIEMLGKKKTIIISQDQYYRDWAYLSPRDREKINFDAPDSFDFKLMHKQLRQLKTSSIQAPLYSYRLHKRLKKTVKVIPNRWVIVEGLLVLHKKFLRELFDFKIYVDIDYATALARRIRRDLKTRGETIESVCRRYFQNVLPMQEKYVEPQKKWVDIILKGDMPPKKAAKILYRFLVKNN